MFPGQGEMLPSLEDFLQRPEWHERAACRGVGVDVFVVGRGEQYDTGRLLCEGCVVREECLEVALADPELRGLWGGTSEVQRKALRRQRVA
jgi:WhiB family redox-sensing transcriptional regulator